MLEQYGFIHEKINHGASTEEVDDKANESANRAYLSALYKNLSDNIGLLSGSEAIDVQNVETPTSGKTTIRVEDSWGTETTIDQEYDQQGGKITFHQPAIHESQPQTLMHLELSYEGNQDEWNLYTISGTGYEPGERRQLLRESSYDSEFEAQKDGTQFIPDAHDNFGYSESRSGTILYVEDEINRLVQERIK